MSYQNAVKQISFDIYFFVFIHHRRKSQHLAQISKILNLYKISWLILIALLKYGKLDVARKLIRKS